MAVVYAATLKDARMTAVLDDVDGGAGAGKLVIGTAGMAADLVTIDLNDPSGTVSAAVYTLSGLPVNGVAAATGTAAEGSRRTHIDFTGGWSTPAANRRRDAKYRSTGQRRGAAGRSQPERVSRNRNCGWRCGDTGAV